MRFHPHSRSLITTGSDGVVNTFQVEGHSRKIASTRLAFPPRWGEFTRDGSELLLTGDRHFFYVYQPETGKLHKISSLGGRLQSSKPR